MAFLFYLLLSLAALQLSVANHCKYNMTKADQVIDVDQSQSLTQFEDIGVLHVDGKTPEDRLNECVDICCHAGAGCNIVSLDTAVKGPDGDNCHLYRCDPPDSCKWTVKKDSQSALVYVPATTTPGPATTPGAPAAAATANATADQSSPPTESPLGLTSPETEGSDMMVNTTTTTPGTENTTKKDSIEKKEVPEGSSAAVLNTTEGMNIAGNVTANGTAAVTPASATPDMVAPNSTDALIDSTTPETSTTSPTSTSGSTPTTPSTMEESTTATTTTYSTTSSSTTPALEEATVTDPFREETMGSTAPTFADTTEIISSTNTSLPPTTSTPTSDYDDFNSTVTPAPLRAKTADMSTTTVTTLALALAAGAMFIGIIATLIGKRAYDNWHRRHYQQIDYLVDGMYGS